MSHNNTFLKCCRFAGFAPAPFTCFLLTFFSVAGSDSDDFFKKFSDEFEKNLAFDMKLDSSTAHQISETVRKFYFKNDHITKEDQEQFIQLKSHELFSNGILYILEKQLQKKTPTYFYKFSFINEVSFVKLLINVNAEGW